MKEGHVVTTVQIRVLYASDRDREAWSNRMYYDMDPKARRRVVAEFALEVTPKVRGAPGSLTGLEVAKYVFLGFSGVGTPLEAFRKADVRTMTVGDVVEVNGVRFLQTLTGFETLH